MIGGIGGYRQVAQVLAADTNAPLMDTVLPFETIQTLFEKAEPQVALSYVPLIATKTVVSETLGYWEGPLSWNQDRLVPVYILTVNAEQEGGDTQQYQAYIPVNASYMAPYAKITSPGDVSSVLPGSTINLKGRCVTDAQRTGR
ncbi:MAG: hypothetical protein R2867_33495 [Caldilineaceae bacterium]